MPALVTVRDTTVDIPKLGRYVRREFLTPEGESIQIQYVRPEESANGAVQGGASSTPGNGS